MEIIYRIERDTLLELINHIDEFKDKMDKFVENNSKYKYNITIEDNETNTKKVANLIVNNDE